MKRITATLPPRPKDEKTQYVAWLLVFVYLIIILLQLVQFEKFVPMVESFFSGSGGVAGKLVAAVIVVSEIFALPFLLRMRLSSLMRLVSLICSLVAAVLLFILSFKILSASTSAVISLPVMPDFTIKSLVLFYSSIALLALALYIGIKLRGDWQRATKRGVK